MARIDPLIEKLIQQKGRELVMQAGSIPWIRTLNGNTSVLRQAVQASQITAAFAEICPADKKTGFPQEGITRWDYESPYGKVLIQVDRRAEVMRGSVQPAVTADGRGPLPTEVKVKASEGLKVVRAEVEIITPPPPPPVVQGIPSDPLVAMTKVLTIASDRRASDIHISSDCPLMLRVDGEMMVEPSFPRLSAATVQAMLWSITPERYRAEWTEKKDTDFAYETQASRFRVNIFADRKGIAAVLRLIPTQIKTATELGLSPAIMDLCALPKGLVLVTGPTGSGKSTTLAAMIDHINKTRTDHLITIEDPIEFQHDNQQCLVNQREVGTHTGSFKSALRAALREDPDVILVGELRDLETISIAMETAETGHLVFGTLHTNTAASTVSRIIDQFPADRQDQVRLMLSESLKGVVAQTLCKKTGGGRIAAHEILLCNSGISNLIREGKTHQIPSAMQVGRGLGMATLNDALLDLVKAKHITPQEAMSKSLSKSELNGSLEQLGFVAPPPKARAAAAKSPSGPPSSNSGGLKIVAAPA